MAACLEKAYCMFNFLVRRFRSVILAQEHSANGFFFYNY